MWQDILKIKSVLTKFGIELVESAITTTPKNINVILEDMYAEIDRRNANSSEHRTGSQIPTRKELENYLSRNYSKVYLSNATKKTVKTHRNATAHYYKEE